MYKCARKANNDQIDDDSDSELFLQNEKMFIKYILNTWVSK